MKSNKYQLAMVTGASRGIGKSISLMLAKEQIPVILISRTSPELNILAEEISRMGSKAYVYPLDITNESQVISVLRDIKTRLGTIDLLINTAGVGLFSSFINTSVEMVKESLKVNTIGTFLITREIVKDMCLTHKGQIINIESIAASKAFRYGSPYIISKYAMAGMTETLWAEVKKYEVKVCSIKPGLVNSSFFDHIEPDCDLSEALSPEDIAHVAKSVVFQSEYSNISEVVIRPIKRQAQELFQNIIDKNFG